MEYMKKSEALIKQLTDKKAKCESSRKKNIEELNNKIEELKSEQKEALKLERSSIYLEKLADISIANAKLEEAEDNNKMSGELIEAFDEAKAVMISEYEVAVNKKADEIIGLFEKINNVMEALEKIVEEQSQLVSQYEALKEVSKEDGFARDSGVLHNLKNSFDKFVDVGCETAGTQSLKAMVMLLK